MASGMDVARCLEESLSFSKFYEDTQENKAVTHPSCAWMIVGCSADISAAKADWWSSIRVVFATITSAQSTSNASPIVPVPG